MKPEILVLKAIYEPTLAALDVFVDEPHVPAELMRMDNVVLAPHMGTSTREVREGRSEKLLTGQSADAWWSVQLFGNRADIRHRLKIAYRRECRLRRGR